ncbi:MAG: AsmA family protein, partial [Alphaproteobacteria bacterium]|nr:AsmA family protein [Alphaproteobacteria bacterium]
MRGFLVALGGLAILLVIVLVAGPRFVDWNRFKPELAELVERATGRSLTIDGDLGFSLLPTPTLSATGVRLGGADADSALVRLKALDARIALGPLLGGRVVVESIALVEPAIVIDTASPATGGWDILDGRLSFDRILVVDGSLEWRGPAGAGRIERINAEITAPSIVGPFRVSGDIAWRGLSWRFELSTGRLGEAAPITASLALRGGGATVRLSGTATLTAGETLLAGRLRADGNRLPALLAAFGLAGRVPAPLAQAATLEGNLQIGRSRIALNDLAMTLGDDMRAGGAAGLSLERDGGFDLALAVNRVDLDKWSTLTAPPTGAASAASLPHGTVDVTVDAVLWRGGVIRQARLTGALGDSGLTIRQAAAQLPGGSDVALFGHLALGDAPRFDGQLEGGADNLRSLFDWLQVDAQAIPPDRLRRVSVTTGLSITGDG